MGTSYRIHDHWPLRLFGRPGACGLLFEERRFGRRKACALVHDISGSKLGAALRGDLRLCDRRDPHEGVFDLFGRGVISRIQSLWIGVHRPFRTGHALAFVFSRICGCVEAVALVSRSEGGVVGQLKGRVERYTSPFPDLTDTPHPPESRNPPV